MSVKSGQSEGTVTVTPSGVPVYFQSEPKRLYRLGPKLEGPAEADYLLPLAQAEDTKWREVPSVTTVLKVLDKPGLPWWGMKVGAEGVIVLHNMGFVKSDTLAGGRQPVLSCPKVWETTEIVKGKEKTIVHLDWNTWVVAGQDQLVMLLKHQKLTVNHTLKSAGSRGQSVHDAFEHWANTGELPDPSIYPPTEVGYINGLLEFFKDVPTAEPVAAEVIVASSEHGFAGRYDLRFKTSEPHDVVFHRTRVRGAQKRRLPAGEFLSDLKTSSGVHPEHAKQCAGLELASVESGWDPTMAQGILHVSSEGEYEFVRSWARPEHFLTTLAEWNSTQEMKALEKAERTRTA